MRNHEVTARQRLLNVDGSLKEPGFTKSITARTSKPRNSVLRNGTIIWCFAMHTQ